MLSGQIVPRSFANPNQACKNPTMDTAIHAQMENSEIFTCPQTGRMWMLGQNGTAGAVRQILPVVRNDGTPSVVSTVATNDSGEMKFTNGTGSTAGKVNLFDVLKVSTNNIRLEGFYLTGKGSLPIVDTSGNLLPLMPSQPQMVALWNGYMWVESYVDQCTFAHKASDQSITTTAATVVSDLTITPGAGTWACTAVVTTQHNNSNIVNVGIQVRDLAPNAGTIIKGAATSSNNTWGTTIAQTIVTLPYDNSQVRVLLQCPDASVGQPLTVKSAGQFDWTTTTSGTYVPTPPATESTAKATYLLCWKVLT